MECCTRQNALRTLNFGWLILSASTRFKLRSDFVVNKIKNYESGKITKVDLIKL